MIRATLLCLTGMLLPGCVLVSMDKPPPGTRFRDIAKPADIAAVYSNQGKGSGGPLSDALFPESKEASSAVPDRIRFQSRNEGVIRCEALRGGKVVATRDLVQNRDFRITGGAMQLISGKNKALATDMAVGVVGVDKESETLRLTDSGNIVLTLRESTATMVMFVVPAGGVSSFITVFERISGH